MRRRWLYAPLTLLLCAPSARAGDELRLSEEALPLAELPARPRPLLELGEPFLGRGTLARGFTLPTGATWQPAFLTWGVLRTAIHDVELSGSPSRAQWANRLDLFTQLSFTPTERVVASFRPLDQDGRFSGYTLSPRGERGGVDEWNADLATLYFEGDFGELFPGLDRDDRRRLDYGFSVGRMPVFFQDGLLVGDALDAVGVVRNALHPPGVTNLRVTGLYAWGHVDRSANSRLSPGAQLFGLFSEADVPGSLLALDLAYVDAPGTSGGGGAFFGLSATQRLGRRVNNVLRMLVSRPTGSESPQLGRGALALAEFSMEPGTSHDLVYLNLFKAFDRYTPAARAAGTGGALVQTGILFEGAGLGAYAPVLGNEARSASGGALGYQKFFDATRTQLVLELAGRRDDDGASRAAALGVRFQQAVGRRLIARLDGFVRATRSAPRSHGGRAELLLKF